MKVEGFDWDAGNSFKSEAKHGLSREVIEAFFHEKIRVAPDPKHSSAEDRFLAIGRGPDGKPMIAVFTLRTKDELHLIRPISARYMHEKEAKRYEQAFTEAKE